ncbi:hypothetical protein ES705_35546 [subsurface metagenome]
MLQLILDMICKGKTEIITLPGEKFNMQGVDVLQIYFERIVVKEKVIAVKG